MNLALVEKIVEAVLYEGYILYPYRPSSTKNRSRFTFGRVYPEGYSAAQKGAEPCSMQTESLVRVASDKPGVGVTVQFLQPMAREIGAVPGAPETLPEGFQVERVAELQIEGKRYQSWQEAVERKIEAPQQAIRELVGRTVNVPFTFAAAREMTPILDSANRVAGVIIRRQEAIQGVLEITAQPIDPSVFRLTVSLKNRTPVLEADLDNQDAVLMRTFTSTHAILHVRGGEFLSLTDPPPSHAEAAAACKNIGVWPVLVGEEEKGDRDAMLASPIILYDYPKIAPETPGDLFDGTEIDEILTLRVMTMTDEEKSEMRNADKFTRRILERTEGLSGEDLLKMHGTIREMTPFAGDLFNANTRLKSASIGGVEISAGDRVRIRPKGRADVMDLALAGKAALVEAVEQDAESRVHLALVLEDDPGKDLGMLRQPGHRFFFGLDEVEVLGEGE